LTVQQREHCFPPPRSVDEADSKLDRRCIIVRDADGQSLAYVYFEDEPGRRAATRRASSRVNSRLCKRLWKY